MSKDFPFFPDFDDSLLETNLNMSIEKRLETHDAALEVAREFEKAGQELRSRSDKRDSQNSHGLK